MPYSVPDIVSIKSVYADEANYLIKKIKLADFLLTDEQSPSGAYSVHWWEINPNLIASDEDGRIYVLDVYKKRILKFSPKGDFISEVTLKDINFPYAGTGESFFYMMQVSSDGKFFYVVEGSNELNWTVFNSAGMPLKKNIVLMKFVRRCNDKFIVYKDVLDLNLNRVKRIKVPDIYRGELFDSIDNFYSLNETLITKKPVLVKTGPDGSKIWKKEIKDYSRAIKMLGVDGTDSIFVLMDGPLEIVKFSKEGEQISKMQVPNDLLFLNKETAGNHFQVLCNGTLVCFPSVNIVKNRSKGEYFIYKFEMNKSTK
jgi:hypothetical protein